jgi:hypothetical protein
MEAGGHLKMRRFHISRYRDGIGLKDPRIAIVPTQQSALRVQDFAFLKGNSGKTRQMGKLTFQEEKQ